AGTVSGSVTINATGQDEAKGTGLASLQIRIDNVTRTTSLTSPASFVWNTTPADNGQHTLTAVATDNAGNVGTSAPVVVTVNTVVAPPPPQQVAVPTLTGPGTNQTTAGNALTGVGLQLNPTILTANDAAPAGQVIAQSIPAGQLVNLGTSVQITTSL